MNSNLISPSINNIYQQKIMSADDAIKSMGNKVKFVTFGCYAATPVALTRAYAKAAIMGFFKHRVDTYLFRSSPDVVKYFRDTAVLKNIHLLLPFMGEDMRSLVDLAHLYPELIQHPEYVPSHFSTMEKGLISQYGDPDVHMLQVSPMDKHGYFSFGLDGSFSIPAARRAKKVIVEVNSNFPRTFGDGIIHISQIDAVVEHKSDLLVIPLKASNEIDNKIANYIIDFIKDGYCIQLGIGGVPDAVGKFLLDRNDLGIHTELLSASQVDLMKNGNVTNKYKKLNRYHTVFNVAMLPSPEYYQALDNNPSVLCYPASYVNDACIIQQIDNMISINSFIEIDLYGQVSSESIHYKQLTGSGGQVDFVRGASASIGGKSILAAHATTKQDTISKIVPRLNNIVTTSRIDVQYVVTEYGCANLAGMTNRQRAETLISLAHPSFREKLTEEAKAMSLIY